MEINKKYFKNKRPHNLQTLELIHTKHGVLLEIPLLMNFENSASLSLKF